MQTSYAGSLLVASPLLDDPNFARSVVLVLDHDDEGAVGLVLNRPTPLVVESVLPVWAELTEHPRVVFSGGPVDGDSALALARMPLVTTTEPAVAESIGVRHLVSDLCMVDLDGDPDIVAPSMSGMRVFAGYSGWSPDQLEDEIAEQAWFVLPSVSTDVFAHEADDLWRSVLRRQPGDLRLLATYPPDPTLN